MALLTAKQNTDLGSWSFLTDHTAHRADLVDVARVVFKTLEGVAGSPPTEADCQPLLKDALLGVSVFTKLLHAKHHLVPALYDYYADAMACLLLDKDWTDINCTFRDFPRLVISDRHCA